MSKQLKAALASLKSNQAVIVGRTAPEKTPKGAILLQFGKTFALQRAASADYSTLAPKLPAAIKALVANGGGVINAKALKGLGYDFDALVAAVEKAPALVGQVNGKKLVVTVRAKRADLIDLNAPAPVAPAKAPKAAKPVAKAPVAPVKGKTPAKVVAKAPEKPAKAAKAAAPAPVKGKAPKAPAAAPAKAAPKAKAQPAPVAPAKGKKAAPVEAPKAKGKAAKAAPAPAPKGKAKKGK